MATITQKDILSNEALQFAMLLHAYKECSVDVQDIVNEMTDIIVDDTSTIDERAHAVDVIVEAMLPGLAADILDGNDGRLKSRQAKEAAQLLHEEEELFSSRVKKQLELSGMTQETLAKLAGVSQPAIANILARQCRPQQRTVQKFAEALDVDPSDLWPVI